LLNEVASFAARIHTASSRNAGAHRRRNPRKALHSANREPIRDEYPRSAGKPRG
jgi:hypothetical protein